ncbi:MAG: hypothetical protein ACR2KE_09215, partial [Candidatus Nanopelagicales bacterium]
MFPRRAAVSCLAGLMAAALLAGPGVAAASGPTQPGSEPAAAAAPVAGPTVIDLPGGTCLKAIPEGLVRLDGPADTRLLARARRTGDGVRLTVMGGSGRIGGIAIGPREVSGDLLLQQGRLEGDVRFDLASFPRLVTAWSQSVRVTATPRDCGWGGRVTLSSQGEGASLRMTGPLATDGTFTLRGGGAVSIARTKVDVSGSLRSGGAVGLDSGPLRRGERATWLLTGATGKEVRLPGASVRDLCLEGSDAKPVVTGTATVGLESPALNAEARLEVVGAGIWRAVVEGSSLASWTMPNAGGLTVQTGQLAGSIGMRAGKPNWELRAPGRVAITPLRMETLVGFTGPSSYSVRVSRGTGGVLGLPSDHAFLGGGSELRVTPRALSGALSVQMPGKLLLDLAGDWRGVTQYLLVPGRGRAWSFTPAISHVLRTGTGAMRFIGPIDAEGGVRLRVGGDIDIAGTKVPVRGYYERSGFTADSLPVWSIAAHLDEVPGGVALKGGAVLAGDAFAITGPGAQPISTIEAWLAAHGGPASSSAAPSPAKGNPRSTAISAPTNVEAALDSAGNATITWTKSTTNGASLAGYNVQTTGGLQVCFNVSSTKCTVSKGSLFNGSYAFIVQGYGYDTWGQRKTGPWSEPSNAVNVGTATGSKTLYIPESGDDTFGLPVTYQYRDAGNWTVTAAGTTTINLYKPLEGLTIPEKDFAGTITSTNGVQTWNVTIGIQNWDDLAKGVDFSGSFSVGNTCPLGDRCPGIEGIYLSGSSQLDFQDASVPDVTATGALLSDGSWARWDATAAPVVFHGITISQPDFTLWKGIRNDTDPNLVL